LWTYVEATGTVTTATAACGKLNSVEGADWVEFGYNWNCEAPSAPPNDTVCTYLGQKLRGQNRWNGQGYNCPGQPPLSDITWSTPTPVPQIQSDCGYCAPGPASLAYLRQYTIGQPGICVFQDPVHIAAVVLSNNSVCQVGTTDTIKGTSGQQTQAFDIANVIPSGADTMLCHLNRPTDGKDAWVVDGGGHAVGTELCQQLQSIGWVQQ